MENIELLVKRLCKEKECEWLEFKHNNPEPEMIAKDVCALANGASLCEKDCSYMIWGVDDISHEIAGTTFNPYSYRKGNEEFLNWLQRMLSDNADYKFDSVEIDAKPVVVLTIRKALDKPVMCCKKEYVRVGSSTKELNDVPAVKVQLWEKLRFAKFETLVLKTDLGDNEVIKLLDSQLYFELQNMHIPTSNEGILHYFEEDGLVKIQANGLYSITNLGAILLARHLEDFPSLERKAVRIVRYKGNGKTEILKQFASNKGYSVDFERILDYLQAILPSQEVIGSDGLRNVVSDYPLIALREILANAIIHQDFSIPGCGIAVEVFDNRIEIVNPGIPLIDLERIIDNPPRSRNEMLSSMMRRFKMCEELGTGWDKICDSCEKLFLPAPKIEIVGNSTKVTLFSFRNFKELSSEERLRICYQHTCLQYVKGERMTNQSLRNRLQIEEKNKAIASRLISDALSKKLIKPYDENTAPRYMQYIPHWA